MTDVTNSAKSEPVSVQTHAHKERLCPPARRCTRSRLGVIVLASPRSSCTPPREDLPRSVFHEQTDDRCRVKTKQEALRHPLVENSYSFAITSMKNVPLVGPLALGSSGLGHSSATSANTFAHKTRRSAPVSGFTRHL